MKIKVTSLFLAVCMGVLTGTVVTGITGCAGDRYSRSTGEQIDDGSVRMRVNSALHDNADYKFDSIYGAHHGEHDRNAGSYGGGGRLYEQ